MATVGQKIAQIKRNNAHISISYDDLKPGNRRE